MNNKYDVIIIGGGINGVGVAQAAAAMGYSVLLLEKNPHLALETSSRSSKLIHGGLRYLESFEFSLVRESLKERELLLKLAPDLVQLQKFNIPIFHDTRRSPLTMHLGLSLYSLLAGLHKRHFYRQLAPRYWGQLDGLKTENLKTVFQYYDAQTDDAALTRSVMASAVSLGAEYQCDAKFIQANVNREHVTIVYQQHELSKTIEAAVLVNASGPWVHQVNQGISPLTSINKPDLVQGTHLVMKSPVRQAYYLEAPEDSRAIFVLPWKQHALLGTTEHLYLDDPADVCMLEEEKNYLLNIYDYFFPEENKVILDTMTGCRVLPSTGNSLFKRSRETHFEINDNIQPRVLAIVGGKLTVYRQTANKVMKLLQQTLPEVRPCANTASLKLTPVD